MAPSLGSVPKPPDEQQRLSALRSLGLLDSRNDPIFDRLARAAARLLRAPIASVTLVDEQRHWCKATYGPLPREEQRAHSFAAHTIMLPSSVLVVPDASEDPRFATWPLVTGAPGVRFYAGAALVLPNGQPIGSLCVYDHQPRTRPGDAELDGLGDLAAITVDVIELGLRQGALVAAEAELKRLAVTDPLTGLSNRRVFDERLDEAVALGRRTRLTLALLMIGVRGVDAIEARSGGQASDAVLIALAERLSDAVREHDLVARIGEEEFVVLLQAVDRAAVAEATGRLHEALSQELTVPAAEDPHEPLAARLEVSIGVALHPGDGEDVASLLRAADLAMYEAKGAGGGVRRFRTA